jgi:hypothetical protein
MQQVKVKPLTIAPLAHEADINLENVRYYEARGCRPGRHVPRRLVACSLPKLHAASDSSNAPWIWDFFLGAQRNPRDLRRRRFAPDLIQECNCVPGQELDVELTLREALANAVLPLQSPGPGEKNSHQLLDSLRWRSFNPR